MKLFWTSISAPDKCLYRCRSNPIVVSISLIYVSLTLPLFIFIERKKEIKKIYCNPTVQILSLYVAKLVNVCKIWNRRSADSPMVSPKNGKRESERDRVGKKGRRRVLKIRIDDRGADWFYSPTGIAPESTNIPFAARWIKRVNSVWRINFLHWLFNNYLFQLAWQVSVGIKF